MKIQEEDFYLEFDEGSKRFDLYLLQVINAKDPKKRREEFKIEGHTMLLESAIKKVINYRLNKKLDVTDLKTYLQEWKKESDKLTYLLKL